jgi:hypothetical protein
LDAYQAYLNPEGLRGCLESGAVRFLKGSWLVELHAQGGAIRRRQDLPEEAFWAPEEALKQACRKERCEYNDVYRQSTQIPIGKLFFHAVSYGWAEQGHPDRERRHLVILARAIALRIRNVQEYGLSDIALFWDFPSLYQPPRSGEEDRLFREGLGAANLIYGHAFVQVWMQTHALEGVKPYMQRGWCRFERAVSSLNKDCNFLLDLGNVPEHCWLDQESPQLASWWELASAAEAAPPSRPPPVTPERLHLELEDAPFTNGKSERDKVEELYRETFSVMAAASEVLDIPNGGWTSEHSEAFADALPRFSALEFLNIWGNEFGPSGLECIMPALAEMPSLKYLWVDSKTFDSHARFLELLPPQIESLVIFYNSRDFCVAGDVAGDVAALVTALVMWLATSPPLKQLCVRVLFDFEKEFLRFDILEAAWLWAGKDASQLTTEAVTPPCVTRLHQ